MTKVRFRCLANARAFVQNWVRGLLRVNVSIRVSVRISTRDMLCLVLRLGLVVTVTFRATGGF